MPLFFPAPLRRCLMALMLAAAFAAAPAQAQIKDDALTVSGVIIDKTAANAVVARDEAMGDARRAAFRKLAERNMPAQAAAELPLPADSILSSLVQDIEIRREKLSATRYVGDFTVRFRDGVRHYITIAAPAADPALEDAGDNLSLPEGAAPVMQPGTVTPAPLPAAGRLVLQRPVLLLPYFQNIAGVMTLWADPNPWRDVWQNNPPQPAAVVAGADAKAAEGKVIVPIGDASDVSAGSDGDMWRGDYGALKRMAQNYGVDTIVVAAANKSGPQLRVDLYTFDGAGLTRRGRVMPVIDPAASDAQAFAQGAQEVLRQLLTVPAGAAPVMNSGQRPQDVVSSVSRDLTAGAAPAPAMPMAATAPAPLQPGLMAPAVPGVQTGGPTRVPVTMQFADFTDWMKAQAAMNGSVPRVQVDIQSISRNQSRFTLGFAGDLSMLQKVLAEKGLMLAPAADGYALSFMP